MRSECELARMAGKFFELMAKMKKDLLWGSLTMVKISFILLVVVLSGSQGEERARLKRQQNDQTEIIAGSHKSRDVLGSTAEGQKEEKGQKGENRERRNLFGLLKTPHRRQPLKLPGVGTPRGFHKFT